MFVERDFDEIGWESPVLVEYKRIAEEAGKIFDDAFYNSVLEVGFKVDKEELAKALEYDRDQYEKGYNDGQKSNELYLEHYFKKKKEMCDLLDHNCSECPINKCVDSEMENPRETIKTVHNWMADWYKKKEWEEMGFEIVEDDD